MRTSVAVRAVIARPDGASWKGRFVHESGSPTDLGVILHRLAHDAHAAHGADGIDTLTRALIDEHVGWNRIEPGAHGLGSCRCHDPVPAKPSWPDGETLTPGWCVTSRYAYILAPTKLRVQVRINGDWKGLGAVSYSRATDRFRFELMGERARALNEAHAWDTDP